MAQSTSQKIKVGIFVVVGTVLLITALYFIGRQKFIFSKNIHLYAAFENVNGLQIGNNVRYSGINIGTVSKIEMTEGGMITIRMSVEEDIAKFIKTDATATINSDGLVGSMVVNIIPGKNQQARWAISGDTIQSSKQVGTDYMLSTLNTTNENIVKLSDDLLKITNLMLEGRGAIGTLINDTILAQNIVQSVVALRKTSEETTLAVSRINKIISKINYDESAAAAILSDTTTANQIRSLFTNLEKSSEDIHAYIDEIKSGKGAINYITQDESLVQQIDTTMTSIKQAADKLDQNMDALKHNFLFRGYFKKQERKEKKKAR